ncbi:MAG: VOC family protein [Pseudomonadota bacterium]
MNVDSLDHLVLTVADVTATAAWYERVLGMAVVTFGGGRTALEFGRQKINLHRAGQEFEPKALRPTPGAGDLCFLTAVPLEHVVAHLEAEAVPIEDGPIERAGGVGPIRSVYVRDPDDNLVEIANSIG